MINSNWTPETIGLTNPAYPGLRVYDGTVQADYCSCKMRTYASSATIYEGTEQECVEWITKNFPAV
jgi:hypothetical protein